MFSLLSFLNRKKMNASFGFYINIATFIKRLRFLIGSEGIPFAPIYKLSPIEDLRNNGSAPGEVLSEKLKQLATEFLKYLSMSCEQVPAVKSKSEYDEWNKYYTLLVENLNWLSSINDTYLPKLKTESDVVKFCEELEIVLEYFDRVTVTETERLFDESP